MLGSGDMPELVADDAPVALDDLHHDRHLSTRTVSFDCLVGRHILVQCPSLAKLDALDVPIISVTPAGTVDNARYKIPLQGIASTVDYFSQMEHVLLKRTHCLHRGPLEMDPRLFNLVAVLRSWPVIEALISSNAR